MEYELDAAIGCSDLLTAQLAPLTSLLTFPSRNTRHQDVPGCHPNANVHFLQARQIQTVWDSALNTGVTFSQPLEVKEEPRKLCKLK